MSGIDPGQGYVHPILPDCDNQLDPFYFEIPDIPNTSSIRFNRSRTYDFMAGRWNVLEALYNWDLSLGEYTWEWIVPYATVSRPDPMASYINFRPSNSAPSIYIKVRACNECGQCSGWHGQWFTIQTNAGDPCADTSGFPCSDDEIDY